MKTRLLLLCIVVIQSGCFMSGPNNNDFFFDRINKLKELEGLYQNIGESNPRDIEVPAFLSGVIWPTESGLRHDLITTIEVRAVNDSTLVVKAYSENVLIKETKFTEGKDFELSSGRILLKQDFGFMLDVFMGPYYEREELGIDSQGHGKIRQSFVVAGLAFFIPVAGGGSADVRFVRIGK